MPGGTALLIDESYNANPASMAAAIALLGQAPLGPRGRRIAVLGDMLELGGEADRPLHRDLAEPLAAAKIDLVYLFGSAHARAVGGPSLGRAGRLCRDGGGAGAVRVDAVSAGDALMVKGSLGSKMGPIVKALERQFSQAAALDQASAISCWFVRCFIG